MSCHLTLFTLFLYIGVLCVLGQESESKQCAVKIAQKTQDCVKFAKKLQKQPSDDEKELYCKEAKKMITCMEEAFNVPGCENNDAVQSMKKNLEPPKQMYEQHCTKNPNSADGVIFSVTSILLSIFSVVFLH